MSQNDQLEVLLERIIEKMQKRSVSAFITYFKDGEADDPGRLFRILNLPEDLLNTEARQILDYLERSDETEYLSYQNFKWKVLAFVSLQDIFDLSNVPRKEEGNITQLRYFYYESKYVLCESVLCGLNGCNVASKQLLRNFIEFNLQHLYYKNVLFETRDMNILARYFKTGISPNVTTLLNRACPDDSFTKPIKKRIQMELGSLSAKSSHPYNQDMSPKQMGNYRPETSLETLAFWVHIFFVLDMVLWLYYVNYPMLFKPVDVLKKFGFSGPVGLFVDKSIAAIIKRSLSEEDYPPFEEYALAQSVVADLMHFYESQSDLSDEEIWSTYSDQREDNDTCLTCYLKMMTKMRAMHEMLSLQYNNDPDEVEKVNEQFLKHSLTYSAWKGIYKRVK